ncbi:MAG TPA: hypothetical protein VN616_18745 [Puia sp.]|nr:hypothetical protein [Puia sp.]
MKQLRIPVLLLLISSLAACNKWALDHSDIYRATEAAGKTVSDAAPLAGAIKGTMLQGKTYVVDSDIYVNDGDTLMIQPGVTLDFHNGSGLVVLGSLFSEGTQAQPIHMTVLGVTKNNTPGLSLTQDSAHLGLWRGIIGGTKCPFLVLKWTHIDFAGNAEGNTISALSEVNESAGTSFNILFQNPNGYFIMEDSWVYGGTDDCTRVSNGKIHIFRNTYEKCGGSGGDCVNVKGGTVGTMAYNFFIGTAYNGQKASNKGQPVGAPQTDIVMYNSTFINDGAQVVPGQRGSTIDFEQGAKGAFYNNLAVNCRVGYRVVNNPVADTTDLSYGFNYQYADSADVADNFFTFGPVCTVPQLTDLPLPSGYLPSGWNYESPGQGSYDGTQALGKMNPMFVNFPLPADNHGFYPWQNNAVGTSDFHLQPGSPLIGKGYTGVQPLTVVPVDPVYGATEVTPPGADLGCYQSNGRGNQH